MNRTIQRRLLVLLVSAASAAGVWKFVPGSPIDRAAFTTVVSGYANPPLFVSGEGSHESPWKLRVFASEQKPDKRQAPVIVSLGDDVDGFFQSSPPAPIDLAVILSNFHRLGARKAATAAVFAWESPDPIGFAALEKALARFDSLVMAAPLSRGAVASPMPPAFRQASIAVSSLSGDGSALPLVNRIAVPGVILAGSKTSAGFSVLETETASKSMPLMARWEDRIVFSFPLLTVLQRLDLTPADLEIRPGEFLRFGAQGPVIPLDSYGRLAMPLKPVAPYVEISAEALIDGGEELFPKEAPDPVILRDDRTAAEPATREFSRMLASGVAAMASEEGLARLNEYPRLPVNWEIGISGFVVVLLTAFCGRSVFVRNSFALGLGGLCAGAQWIAVGTAGVWLPGLPAVAAVLAALAVGRLMPEKKDEPAPKVEATVPEEMIQNIPTLPETAPDDFTESAIPLPSKSAQKKTAAKKPAAKKTAAPKKPADKTRSPKTSRGKKPPPPAGPR